jgi:clan AA aspartic protease
MISGKVTSELHAIVRIHVCDANDIEHEIAAVVDTGFNGYLTLPSSAIAELEFTWLCRQQCILGDGNVSVFDVFKGQVNWEGQSIAIEVECAETDPLIGMALLHGFELRMSVINQGPVTITAIQSS